MTRPARNDLLAGLIVLVVVAIFATRTGAIYVDPYDPGLSAKDFPIGVLVLSTLLALGLIGSALPELARTGWRMHESGELAEFASNVLPIVVLGFLYIWFVEMFQYALPTFLAGATALVLFGNRGFMRVVVAAFAMMLVFYLVFYGVLGLYEANGSVWSYETQQSFQPLRRFLGMM